jgi:hypothetical protein
MVNERSGTKYENRSKPLCRDELNIDELALMWDVFSLITAPSVFYRPGEEPKDGKCPFGCGKEMKWLVAQANDSQSMANERTAWT